MEEMFLFAVGFCLVCVVIAVFVSLSKQEAARKKRERKEQGRAHGALRSCSRRQAGVRPAAADRWGRRGARGRRQQDEHVCC